MKDEVICDVYAWSRDDEGYSVTPIAYDPAIDSFTWKSRVYGARLCGLGSP
jgi:hypothetical protein